MLTFDAVTWRYDPYPIGRAVEVFTPVVYDALVEAFPPEDAAGYVHLQGKYNKLSLSERNNKDRYKAVVMTHPVWRAFHAYVKSRNFVETVIRLVQKETGVGMPGSAFTSRFEFSSLPGDGGGIEPHTDIPSKVITLIVPMLGRQAVWADAWGGGTDVLRPLDPWRRYEDYQEPRKAFDVVDVMPYAANQAVVFIKTFNSWHGVAPIQAPTGTWRRSLTVNIEGAAA